MGLEQRALLAPELKTTRSQVSLTLPLFKWASPRSFKWVRVKVSQSNCVAPATLSVIQSNRRKVMLKISSESDVHHC
ncbi:hypothetical protein HYC85_013507 [Camellia sinensis]|uniref:Uncharacterized protein n=1 Tax=Camellia sinensis TaxID=4442 RepID=A0A7J7H3J5_CAMSI|nr:hypothetical protein HYC85_013507 [Camellia sinensis]